MRWYDKTAKLEITDITEKGLSVEEDVSAGDVDQDELDMGREVELEHTDKEEISEKIALDHLAEIPDYYTRLKEMEDEAKDEGQKKASARVVVKVADFQPPKSGKKQPISITWKNPSLPSDPYYLIDAVNSGRDARGNTTWDAPGARGLSGEPKTIHSSDVQSWRPYSGPLYGWHEDERRREKQALYERENKAKIDAFKEANRFQDGRAVVPGMMIMVDPQAKGDLGMFAGRRLQVKEIDYDAGTVQLKFPTGIPAEDPEFEQFLSSIPVTDLTSGTRPAVSATAENRPVTLQNGQKILERDLPSITPLFGEAMENGQVSAAVRVFSTYESGQGKGMEIFSRDMTDRGYEPGEGEYSFDATPPQYDPLTGQKKNLWGPYSATLRIVPPISPDLVEEIAKIAPRSVIKGSPQTGLTVHSKPLFLMMIDAGHSDKIVSREDVATAGWLSRNCRFASLLEEPLDGPEWAE